jgi:hypothetical protein
MGLPSICDSAGAQSFNLYPVDPASIHAGEFDPIAIEVKSLGGVFDLKVTEIYPVGFRLYNPATGAWITDNPLIHNMHLEPDETKTIFYYGLTPDQIGTYTMQTEVGYMENGTYHFYQSLSTEIVVNE